MSYLFGREGEREGGTEREGEGGCVCGGEGGGEKVYTA